VRRVWIYASIHVNIDEGLSQNEDDLKGMSMDDIFDRVQQRQLHRLMADYQIRTKTGEIRWLRDMVSALRDKSGHCYAFMASCLI